jgi:hypothetical protein
MNTIPSFGSPKNENEERIMGTLSHFPEKSGSSGEPVNPGEPKKIWGRGRPHLACAHGWEGKVVT